MELKDKDQLQFDFLPLTLSIETLGGMSTPLIRRGTPLPAKRSQIFSTAENNQKSVEIKVLLGERPLAKTNLRIGSCLLENIPPAPKGQPEIRVTFEVDKFCKVKVEAVKLKSTKKIEARLEETVPNLTSDMIQRLLKEAKGDLEEDNARSAMNSAELRVRKDQERNLVTATTRKLETLVAEMGVALMESNRALMSEKTEELEKLLAEPKQTPSPFGYGGFGDIFDSFYQPKPTRQETYHRQVARPVDSRTMTSERTNSLATVATHTTALIQSFLESIDPEFEVKRAGAWEAIESNRPDARAQASHSMREVLRQLLEKLAPTEAVQKALGCPHF